MTPKPKVSTKTIFFAAVGAIILAAVLVIMVLLSKQPSPSHSSLPPLEQALPEQTGSEPISNDKVDNDQAIDEQAVPVAWKITTQDQPWQDGEALLLSRGTGEKAQINISTSALGQEVAGFGGAFNEKGWVALSVLPPDERDAVI